MSVPPTRSSHSSSHLTRHHKKVKKSAEAKANDVAVETLDSKNPPSHKRIRKRVRRVKEKAAAESASASIEKGPVLKSETSHSSNVDDVAVAALYFLSEAANVHESHHHQHCHDRASTHEHHSSNAHHTPSSHCSNQHISSPDTNDHSLDRQHLSLYEPSHSTSTFDSGYNHSSNDTGHHVSSWDLDHHTSSFDTSGIDHHHN